MGKFGIDRIAERSGRIAFAGERTIWFYGPDAQALEAVTPLLEALQRRHLRQQFAFTAGDGDDLRSLVGRFAGSVAARPPLPGAVFARRYLLRLNVRLLVVVEPFRALDSGVLHAAQRRGVPVVVVDGFGPDGATPPPGRAERLPKAVLPVFEQAFVGSEAAAQALAAAGLPAQRVAVVGPFAPSLPPAEGGSAASHIRDALGPLLGRDLKVVRSRTQKLRAGLEGALLSVLQMPSARELLAFRVERIASLETLRRELGDPRTILCLGNGPSSEDPRLGEVRYDALFRVNDMWLERGYLTDPDMVFTGSRQATRRVAGAIFGFRTIESEARLVRNHLFRLTARRLRYATLQRFPLFLYEHAWQAIKPTNGAAMLAAAVALQPERLVIAGIDLYSHPEGSYPGNQRIANAYTPGHEPETELQILLEALSRFRGELVILSPALEEKWKDHLNRSDERVVLRM